MDAQIENHLPLITSRLVFAPKVFPAPPTITSRMEFPFIHIEARDDSPAPENGGNRLRAEAPVKRAATPGHGATSRRASTPSRRAGTPSRRASTPKVRAVTPRLEAGPSSARENRVVFEDTMDLDSLSSLTEDEDIEETDGEGSKDADYEHEQGGAKLILKPKGETSRPGRGGYNLFKILGWNQKTYNSVLEFVTNLAREKLDTTRSYRYQSKKAMNKLLEAVQEEYDFVKDYDNGWPVHDMLKTFLKNSSQTARNARGRETAEKIDRVSRIYLERYADDVERTDRQTVLNTYQTLRD